MFSSHQGDDSVTNANVEMLSYFRSETESM